MKILTLGIAICIIITIVIVNYNREKYIEPTTITTMTFPVPDVTFPFKNLYDDKGERLNVILISAPFRTVEHEELYKTYKERGMAFCGISSYLDFPNKILNPYEDRFHEQRGHNYPSMASTWLHCFRKKDYTKPFEHLPNLLLTEADLKDVNLIKQETYEKEYDFLYCCLADDEKECKPGWQSYNRNWELAKRCLIIMCRDYNLKGLLIGRQNCEFANECTGIVKTLPLLDFYEFQKEMKKCRFLFVPNISDASPRVITEAICYNIPVLVNHDILGGWHNIVPSITGEFFYDENDISEVLNKMLNVNGITNYRAREWFERNRGRHRSGKILADFLIQHYPNLNNKKAEYAYITI